MDLTTRGPRIIIINLKTTIFADIPYLICIFKCLQGNANLGALHTSFVQPKSVPIFINDIFDYSIVSFLFPILKLEL